MRNAKRIFDKLVKEKLVGKGDGTHYSHIGKPPASAKPVPPIAPALNNSRGAVSPDVVFSPELLTRITEEEAQRFARDPRYIFQTKQDGDRLTIRVDEENIYGFNKLGQVVRLDAKLQDAVWQVCRLQGSVRITKLLLDGEWEPTGFYGWELLECQTDLRELPYESRLELLETFLADLIPELAAILHITRSARTTEEKLAMLADRTKEGVAVKLRSAPFRPGRNGQHKKFKFEQTASFLVGPKPARLANDGKRSVALYLFDPASTPALRFVSTAKVPEKYELPPLDSIIEVRYLYAYPSGGIAQPCVSWEGHDLKVRTDVRPQDCTTAQLKFKAKSGEEEDSI